MKNRRFAALVAVVLFASSDGAGTHKDRGVIP